jgi:hypothetical protein
MPETTQEWVPTADAVKLLQTSQSALFFMKQVGQLEAGIHFYKTTPRKLLWNVEAIRKTQIEKTIADSEKRRLPEIYV